MLIAGDGSEDAKAAITQAGALFPGKPTTVVGASQTDVAERAREGPELARSAGL